MAANDWGLKKQLYQNTFRIPAYFWSDSYALESAGSYLSKSVYEFIHPMDRNVCGASSCSYTQEFGMSSEQLRFLRQKQG